MKQKKILFIFAILSNIIIHSQNISIRGSVHSEPLNNTVDSVEIKVIDLTNYEQLASTITNNAGNYSLEFTLTDVISSNPIKDEYFISNAYPNPFNPSTNIHFNTPRTHVFNVEIFNVIGERIFYQGYSLNTGGNKINISGLGTAGIYFFRISNKSFTQTKKLIQLDGNSSNTKVEIFPNSNYLTPLRKINSQDSLEIIYEKNGYISNDTTISISTLGNDIIDAKIERIPQITEAEITTMKIIGENLPNFPVHFVVGGKDSVYTSDANGLIPFRFKDFNDPYVDSMMVYIDDPEDESENDQWMGDIIVKENSPNANMGDGEIAQNVAINRSEHEDFYLQLNQLNDVYNIAMKFTPRFGELGDGSIGDLKDPNISDMVNTYRAPPNFGHVKWKRYEVSPGVIADTLYTIIQTNYADTGEPVEQILLDRAFEQLNLLRSVYEYQPNRMKTMNFSEIKFIEDLTDPLISHLNDVYGLQNMYLVEFKRGGNPGNTVKKRDDADVFQYAIISLTQSSGPATVLSEMSAGMGGYADAGGVNVGSRFTVLPDLNKISEFGKLLANFTQEYKERHVILKAQ